MITAGARSLALAQNRFFPLGVEQPTKSSSYRLLGGGVTSADDGSKHCRPQTTTEAGRKNKGRSQKKQIRNKGEPKTLTRPAAPTNVKQLSGTRSLVKSCGMAVAFVLIAAVGGALPSYSTLGCVACPHSPPALPERTRCRLACMRAPIMDLL